jgi:hypothetical protein
MNKYIDFDIINYTKNSEGSMKNISFAQSTSSQKIRDNRLRMR